MFTGEIKTMHPQKSFVSKQPMTDSQKETLLGKTLPMSLEAEKSVLGAVLMDDSCFNMLEEHLRPEDFYMLSHQIIFKHMLSLVRENQRIDMITLQDHLTKEQELTKVGDVSYLIDLQENIPSFGMLEQHIQIIKAKAVLRHMISSSVDIITSCYSQNEQDVDTVIDEAEKKIFQIIHNRTKQNFVQLNIWLKKTFQHLSSIKSSSRGITGVSTQFKTLDRMTSGFQPGDLIILAARPSMGKTSFALNVAINVARQGVGVGVFSLEMAAEQLTLRLLSTESGIDHQKIRNATISSDEWIGLTHVAAELGDMKLFIDDTAGINIMELRTKARQLKSKHDISMLVVDYLQLLHGARRHENRHQEVSEISRFLKALAKELSIPIIALSQLSRAVDSRMDKRPMLSDLRESGAIEQDADLIMFLYRDIVYNQETEHPDLAELIIGKQRNGPTGTVPLRFVRELTKFEDAE
ncbi:replicative DNA helicase [Candidatus Babeliales bacterium]|nr:replicative DNA helicase [Candidatus Babeliales bacterium]